MANVFSKVRIATLSVVHGVLDKVIDMNSVEAVKQYIRDLETSRNQLGDSLAEARGHRVGVNRESEQLKLRPTKLNQQIDALLSDGNPDNDHLANTLEAELVGIEERLGLNKEDLGAADQTVQALEKAHSALSSKLTAMTQQLTRLQSMDRTAKAKENAANAMRQATQVSTSGSEASVDSVAARVQRRADVADEKFKSAMGTFVSATEEDSALATVAARLAERKKRLATTVSS